MQSMRHSENNMVIFRWQQLTHSIRDPLISSGTPTIGAMTIAATVILMMYMIAFAVVALILMHANSSGVAFTQLTKNSSTIWIVL